MDFLSSLREFIATLAALDTQPSNQALLISLVFSFGVIALSIVVTMFIKNRSLRVLTLPLLFVAALLLSEQFSGSISEYLVNLSTEFLGAMIALLILSEWIVEERWAVALVAAVVLALPFAFQASGYASDEFVLNLRADLLGGFIVFTLFHRRWLVNSTLEQRLHREEEQTKLNRKINTIALDKLRTERLRRQVRRRGGWDFDIIIRGSDAEDIAAKQGQLRRVAKVLHSEEPVFDPDHHCCYRFLVCALRPAPAADVQESTVRLRVRGPEGVLGPVLETIREVFEVDREQRSSASSAMFVISPPNASFSQAVVWTFQGLLDNRLSTAAQGGGGGAETDHNADFEAGYALAIRQMIDAIQPGSDNQQEGPSRI